LPESHLLSSKLKIEGVTEDASGDRDARSYASLQHWHRKARLSVNVNVNVNVNSHLYCAPYSISNDRWRTLLLCTVSDF